MNISHEHQVIWLAPERCATSITKRIFENYNFFAQSEKKNDEFIDFKEKTQSHQNFIPETYFNYKIITNIRNPYDLTFSFYINFYISEPLTRESTNFKEKFNTWISKVILNHGPNFFICPFYNDSSSFFQKWKFDNHIEPDFVLKTENLYENLLKLPFIAKESEERKEEIKNMIQSNGFINKRYQNFNDFYDIRSAKLVYNFFKPIFYKFDYNPFSFTKEKMNNDEKISFLHKPIDE